MNDNIFTIGTTVYCDDKECGKLTKVVIDPEKWLVSDLVVEEGMLLKRARVFPVGLVAKATADEIFLLVSEDKLSNYPEYRENVVERAVDKDFEQAEIVQGSPYGLSTSSPPVPMVREVIVEGVPDHLSTLGKDTCLKITDSAVGSVHGVAASPENGLITYLLIHKGTIFVDEFWLSTSQVDHFYKDHVHVNLDKEELEQYIEQQHEAHEKHVESRNVAERFEGETHMNGMTNGQDTAVLNDDTKLIRIVSERLLADSRTAEAIIEVIPERGQVTLTGTVDSPEIKKAAEEIVSDCPGVVTVSNQLAVE